jgi:DNA-binding transcriptional MerR regulator
MAYTVTKIAKLSGVSVRTLHFYDEIELLKPAYYGDNNYRYYEEAQLLILQQILFFRELGFQLSDIQRIISSPDFDKMKALESHRKILEKNLSQTQQLIETVDKTIAHLRGKETMKLEEIFLGFNAEKQKLYENFLVDSGVSQDVINKSKDKIKNWTKEQWMENKREADKIHAELVSAINHHLDPSSPEVQKLIKKHYQMTTAFWTPTRETYIGLSQLYCSHPDFVKFYDEIHPKLLRFLVEAMKIFAEHELS